MRAQILSIGSELILGHLTDTNATFLAQQLAGLGIELTLVTQVGDDLARLAAAIERATNADDLTREAIAQVVGETPVVQPELLETIKAFFRSRGIEMPERNAKQAWMIPSAETLLNPVGTAPGWFVRRNGHVITAMPGVPREMFKMWREQVVPRLIEMKQLRAIRTITIRTIGIGESAAEQVLHDLVALENPVVATYAKDDGVHVRVTATGESSAEAEFLRDGAAAEVTRRLAPHIYGTDDTTLPQALSTLLRERGLVLSVTDCGGGGRFGALLASHPASTGVLASALMSPQTTGLNAAGLAAEALSVENANLGLGIHVEMTPSSSEGVFEGIIEVALSGERTGTDRTPMRSGFEDVQRRSALIAADLVRKALSV